ncbi:hypothetical protein RJ639_040646 [Escallonia herrerae]|uniref:Uncharacterized protein n=1 Tax=Escallonia herrerae TaxID=1293975 RepID=A0AA88WH17_9ASTE|nr:hypothetical protein RJ639_040646 [Escallonia herrerae]
MALTENNHGEVEVLPRRTADQSSDCTKAARNSLPGGFLYAVDAWNGELIWKQNLGELTGLPATGTIVNKCVSRATPTVAGDPLLVGIYGPAVIIALGPRPLSIITASGTVYMGAFYVGVSSLVTLPAAICCTFRGSLVKLDLHPRCYSVRLSKATKQNQVVLISALGRISTLIQSWHLTLYLEISDGQDNLGAMMLLTLRTLIVHQDLTWMKT